MSRPRETKRGRRRGEISKEVMSPTAADSSTEVRGRGATSPTTAGGAIAAVSPTITDKAGGAVRGEMAVSPMTAVAIRAEAHGETATSPTTAVVMEAAAQAEATASPTTGGSGVLASRAHPGAVRVLTRPLGPIAVGRTTRARTATSDRAAAQQGLPAL